MKSKTRYGKVTKKNETNLRGISTKQKNVKVTRSKISTKSINQESSEPCLCVDMNESDTIETSPLSPAALVIDEGITFGELDAENSTIKKPDSRFVNETTLDHEGTDNYTVTLPNFATNKLYLNTN